MDRDVFIDKYKNIDERLLNGRIILEGKIVGCLWSNPDLYGDYKDLESNAFITEDGKYYYSLGKRMAKKGYEVFDEITVLTYIQENDMLKPKFENKGGFDNIKEVMATVNIKNTHTYIDDLFKANIIIGLYQEGFNIFNNITISEEGKEKEIIPFDLFKNMSSSQVSEWYDWRVQSITMDKAMGNTKIVDLDLDDSFVDRCNSGEMMGLPYDIIGEDIDGKKIYGCPILNSSTLGIHRGYTELIGAFSGCVDKDTEFFNGQGWKKISDYNENDMVLQYNEDGTTDLVYPLKYIKNKNNKLWHFKTKYGLDQCLSDNHTVVYLSDKGNIQKQSFKDIKTRHESNKSGFNGDFITTFNYEGQGIELTNEEIELMCAVICDGYFGNFSENKKCRLRVKKQRKKEKMEELLNRMKINYEIQYNGEYNVYIFIAPRKEKYFSSYWYNSNKEQLKIIVDNILYWDGWQEENGIRKQFSTTIKETADFIQFAFSSCGYRTTISTFNRIGKKHSDKNYEYKTIEYTLNITSKKLISMGNPSGKEEKKTKINPYITKDGYEYCFTVPSHMLVLRRNDRIFITGNCGKSSWILAERVMPIIFRGEKIALIANEMAIDDYKAIMLPMILAYHFHYFGLTRKHLKKGNLTEEQLTMIKKAQKYYKEHYLGKLKFVDVDNYDMNTMKTVIRKLSRQGVNYYAYDTFKAGNMEDKNARGQLIEASKALHQLAKKYNVAITIIMQCAIYMENVRYVTSGCLSEAKAVKEIVTQMVLFRKIFPDEFAGEKYDIKPYRLMRDKVTGKFLNTKEFIDISPDKQYRIFFLSKTRADEDDKCILQQFDGAFNVWKEIGLCTVSHVDQRAK